MPRQIAPPSELDLESPGRRDYWVSLRHTSVWGTHLIPLTVIVGREARPGEGLVAFGGTHGNEYEGPVALKHLLREIRTEDVLGRIILVPVLNVAAFEVDARASLADDGHNLNRVFVTGAGTTPAMAGITHRIAAFVRESIWPHVHIVIDIHSGGQEARFMHWVSFRTGADSNTDDACKEIARWFGTPLICAHETELKSHGPESPGSYAGISRGLHNEAVAMGKLGFGSELGWGASTDPRGVSYARNGVLAAAIHHNLLRGEAKPIGHHADGTQRVVGETAQVLAPYPGHFEPLMECGEIVEQGRTVALLHDFYRLDEEPLPIIAGADGMVTSMAWGARVVQGQTLLNVGTLIE